MTNAFTRKLSRFVDFSDEEIAVLDRLSANPEPRQRGIDLVRQGERTDVVNLLLRGWAYRYKVLKDGQRQIVGYLLPGDICDLHVALLNEMEHSVGLLTDALVVQIPADEIHVTMNENRRIERALWCSTLVDEAVLREWLANIGQREAFSRIGHHFCELWHRMRDIGLVSDDQFDMPLTQEVLGDTLGLTSVHVNRTLKRLRDEGLLSIHNKRLTVLNPQKLTKLTGFDPSYLFLGKARAQSQQRSGRT
ncbi:MAG: Crp/Fnr family transcriptional regulator [Sphingomonas sp.]|jgi:CRP-like cAMP-binding protein|nr:Crp/Fnr family transcriptional regulator [Sphingomonas sp.]